MKLHKYAYNTSFKMCLGDIIKHHVKYEFKDTLE